MWRFKAPKEEENTTEFFIQNGAYLLEELIISCNGKSNPIRNFSIKELLKATNNYHRDHILRTTEEFTLFKGRHEDQFITVKKFKGNDRRFTERCVNEVVMLSQINHKNVLKLLGCCLDTEVPILVYEYAANGDLFEKIIEKVGLGNHSVMSWESRLRIATGIANAVSYIHTATSKPIIHRDIKSGNILLDQNYVPKLSDFSFSISIPLGETHVEDAVRGTIGFIAPEYIASGRLTEKADVFSFGMLLLELLTGKTPWSLARLAESLNILFLDYFRSFIDNNRLREIVDSSIWEEEEEIKRQLQTFAELIVTCTEETPTERPTMMEVTKKLRQIERCLHP
ncbi:hypothetical protein GIB67_022560 [Kingdonia uniflora]|uniref:Protein kinase domain-containing protein n=1 Tax=Kingdonia uniflora TaxID=39325 RepID=A0A7J7L7B1_9MAGN|nr:hypothetical protein GIB67_022560 [Kingdonia uniflora]